MTVAFTLRAALVRWRRLLASAVTVAFGVAMVSGALIFTDTTHAVFQRLFARQDGGAQLIVAARQLAGTGAASGGAATQTPGAPAIPPRLIRAIGQLRGVRAVAGELIAPVTIVGANGHALSVSPPAVAMSALPSPFDGSRYQSGAAPRTRRQIAIDAVTAAQQHWRVGDRVAIVSGQPAARFIISGIASLGAGGAQRFVIVSRATARQLYGTADVSQVDIATAPGVDRASLAATIARRLPSGLVLERRGTQVQAAVDRVATAFGTLDGGLLAFAIVAVLIGALVIFNTFATTATGRRRELALLRALGATRVQVLGASLLEALLIGMLGAILGVIAGPFVALAVRALFTDVTHAPLSVGVRPLALGVAVGIGVSLLAALAPAVSASRAAPVEALRNSQGALSRGRPVISMLLRLGVSAGLGAGGLILTLGAAGDQSQRLSSAAIGEALMLAAALLATPLAVGVCARLTSLRRGDPILELARSQALAQRGRVALSASSLMIGVALALVLSVYAAGLRAATSRAVDQTVLGDIVVESADAARPIPAASIRAVAAVPDLGGVSALKTVTGRLAGAGAVQVAGVDPTSWREVYRFRWRAGGPAAFTGLAPGQALVEFDTARAAGLRQGSLLRLRAPDGRPLALRVAGIYRDGGLLKGIVVPLSYFGATFAQPQLQDVFVKLSGSVSAAVAIAALRHALARFPGVVVADQRQLAAQLAANITSVVDLLDALLALAVLMSLLGIGGSLSLGVQTRSGELGTLRALGMTPAQARALVRDESLLTALIGGVGGIALGLVLAVCLAHALAPDGFVFAFPWAALGGAVAATLIAGLGAAAWPGRRAAQVPMLAAISYE